MQYSKYSNTDVTTDISMNEVEVSFEIDECGEISNISLDSTLSQENFGKAMETIDQIRSWIPEQDFGNRCKIKLSIPVAI